MKANLEISIAAAVAAICTAMSIFFCHRFHAENIATEDAVSQPFAEIYKVDKSLNPPPARIRF